MDCLNSGIILRFWVNHGRWEIILVQPGLLHPFNWCKYIFDLVFNTKYVTDFLGFSMFEFVD